MSPSSDAASNVDADTDGDAHALALRNGTVVDVDGHRTADVGIDADGRIAAVGEVGPAERDHDVAGRYVVPGLIDAHVHLVSDASPDLKAVAARSDARLAYETTANLRAALSAGVTAVRDLGARGTITIDAREAVAEGVVSGPRIAPCGENVTVTGGHGHYLGGCEADGPAAVRAAARRQLKRGADVIKGMATGGVLTSGTETGAPELTPEELAALVQPAAAKGVPTAAHAHGLTGIRNAVEAGITSVEHGTFMDAETAAMMAERDVYWVPTAAALAAIVEHGTEGGIPAAAVAKAEAAVDAHAAAFDHALEAGVTIAMGSDAGTPFNPVGPAAVREMELLVERGLDPMHALRAATVNAAALLGLDDVGRVTAGYRADLVVLDADPAETATAWRDPALVVADGTVA